MSESSEKKAMLKVVHREGDSGLVVLDCGEGSGFGGGDGGVAGNNDTEDITLHCDAEGQGSNVQKDKVMGLVRCLAGEDRSLDSSTISDSLIRIDGLVELATAEVLRHQRLNLGNTSGTTDEDNIVDLFTRHLGILKDTLDGVNGRFEHGSIDFLEPSPADVGREVLTLGNSRTLVNHEHSQKGKEGKREDLVKRIDFDGRLSDTRQRPLRTFASAPETPAGTRIIRDIQLGLPLELLLEMF